MPQFYIGNERAVLWVLSGEPLQARDYRHSHPTIGRVQKIPVENQQAYYQSQVSTGKRRPDRLMVLGDYTGVRLVEFSLM